MSAFVRFSALPSYRTGLALAPYSDAFLGSFDNQARAIFTGKRSDLKVKVNTDRTTNTVYGFKGGATGSAKVLSDFRADAFNLFNHPNFGPPALSIVTNASNFCQITSTNANPPSTAVPADDARVGQFSLRLQF